MFASTNVGIYTIESIQVVHLVHTSYFLGLELGDGFGPAPQLIRGHMAFCSYWMIVPATAESVQGILQLWQEHNGKRGV